MLVFTRNVGEGIKIGHCVEVVLSNTRPDEAAVRLILPKPISVDRCLHRELTNLSDRWWSPEAWAAVERFLAPATPRSHWKMVHLAREESVVIGGIVELVLTAIEHGRTRFGITAPPALPVHRSEVYDKMIQEGSIAPTAP